MQKVCGKCVRVYGNKIESVWKTICIAFGIIRRSTTVILLFSYSMEKFVGFVLVNEYKQTRAVFRPPHNFKQKN